ncbi:MAG TPA: hypothetical protein VFB56_10650 [Nitrospiraceae bacterium]|nr:hypothetical protein [Nitrospiraceae bacterium]
MVITDTSHFSPERAEVVEADAPAHGLVIFDKDLRVQYVNRQARRMMEQDGSLRTEFDPQASLSLHVVKAATKVQEWWHEHPSEPDAELCIQHSFQLRDECVTVTAFGLMRGDDPLQSLIHVNIMLKTIPLTSRPPAFI